MRKRAEELCASAPDYIRDRAVELAVNVIWIESKLSEAREAIGRSQVTIPYDNGGGQKGVRRNPAFDGYNALISSYTKALSQLENLLEPQGNAGKKSGQSALDALRKSAVRLKCS